MLLDYAYTYPNSVIQYYSSEMVLNIDSVAAYLVFTNARSGATGNFTLSNWHSPKTSKTKPKQMVPF